MCGSKSSTKSIVDTKTEVFDERIGAADNAVVIQLQDGATVELTDEGAVTSAGLAFEAFESFAKSSFGFAEEQLGEERGLTEQALKLVEKRTQSEEANIAGQGITALLVISAAAAAIIVGPKLLRRG